LEGEGTDVEQNQDRRRHYHRGRRGPDRRGVERRTPPQGEGSQQRDGVDVEQIMRDIRARIAQHHGIELTNQQIQDLAARRLEAILDPRAIKPALLDELRRSAGTPVPAPPVTPEPAYTFDDTTLFASQNAFVRLLRKLFAPFLRLLFNPKPIARALGMQSRLNVEAAQREAARTQQQAEWNALHYEILQRLVIEVSRVSIDMQALTMKVESLSTKVDFNDRRVRGIEAIVHQPRSSGRPVEPQAAASTVVVGNDIPAAAAAPETSQAPGVGQSGDGTRRRRRRRRGRRGTMPAELAGAPATDVTGEEDGGDGGVEEETGSDEAPAVAEALAPGAATDTALPAAEPAAPPELPSTAAEPANPDPGPAERE
jgi:hypothetical protein